MKNNSFNKFDPPGPKKSVKRERHIASPSQIYHDLAERYEAGEARVRYHDVLDAAKRANIEKPVRRRRERDF